MKTIKLSELPKKTEVVFGDSDEVFSAAELIKKINDGTIYINAKLYLVNKGQWKPDVKSFLENYLESEPSQIMIEDADEVLESLFTDELAMKLEKFFDDEGIHFEWLTLGRPVVIDFENIKVKK